MDLRSFASRATDRIKSIFSRNNSFFYGTAEQREQYEPYQPTNRQYEQEAPYVQTAPHVHQGQQPSYQGMAQQAYQQPYYQQGYQQQPQLNPQQNAWQTQAAYTSFQQEQQQANAPYAPPVAGISPQQMQLNQQQQTEQETTGRNRRSAQHQQAQSQPEGTVLPFPGTQPQEGETPRMDAYVINVQNISSCRQAMTCLRKNQCTLVVMDQLIDKAEVRRYVDMLNGACFALGGTMTRLSSKVGFYLLAPSGMMVYIDPVTANANAPQQRPSQASQQPAYQPQGSRYMPPMQPTYQQPYQPAQQPQQQHAAYSPSPEASQQYQYPQNQYEAQRFAK